MQNVRKAATVLLLHRGCRSGRGPSALAKLWARAGYNVVETRLPPPTDDRFSAAAATKRLSDCVSRADAGRGVAIVAMDDSAVVRAFDAPGLTTTLLWTPFATLDETPSPGAWEYLLACVDRSFGIECSQQRLAS